MKKMIKSILRPPYNYLRYLYLRYVKKYYFSSCELRDGVVLQRVTDRQVSYYGYYTTSPENEKGQVLFCSPLQDGKIGVYVNDKGRDFLIGETAAHNLQQGCMSQWGYTHQNKVYYNRYNNLNDCYECVVYDVDIHQEIGVLPMPVNALSKQEDYALSLNYDRLAVMRPDYGYFCRKNVSLPDNEHDGIWYIDMQSKEVKLIISLQQLISLQPADSMVGAQHKVNHIDIAPDGKRFMFLHRWVGPKGRYMRLITANADGSDLCILNGDIMTSHSYWIDGERIVSFCYTEEYGNAYTMFTDKSVKREQVSSKLPICDGHPSTIKNGEWMITDTYPSHDAMSKLYLYNLKTDELIKIGRFYQPIKYSGQRRIDLHPKWNMAGDRVFFESGHDGYRNLYCIDVSPLIK